MASADREGRIDWFGYLDWGAILASVFAGLGITLLLVAFGSAAGIEAADDGGDETRISTIVGTWTVISALIGTFAGTFIGGRYSRLQSGASATYNALTSWGSCRCLPSGSRATGSQGFSRAACAPWRTCLRGMRLARPRRTLQTPFRGAAGRSRSACC